MNGVNACCCSSKVFEPENWPPNSPDLYPVDRSFSVGSGAADGVSETRANRLLDSAKPGHVEPNDDRSAKNN